MAPTVNKKGGTGQKGESGASLTRLFCTTWAQILFWILFLLLFLVLKEDIESTYGSRSLILQPTSGKMCSSNSVVQAQKLVDQLRLEASMERIKVCRNLTNYMYIVYWHSPRLFFNTWCLLWVVVVFHLNYYIVLYPVKCYPVHLCPNRSPSQQQTWSSTARTTGAVTLCSPASPPRQTHSKIRRPVCCFNSPEYRQPVLLMTKT